MAGNPQIIVDFVANTAKLAAASSEVTSTGGKFSKWGKTVGGAVAGAFAVGAAVKFGKSAVDAAQESAVATARLEAVFKSMGDTTGTAAQAAEDYASSLSRKIGVDDEAIMAAQAMLATFGAVSSETARSSGIFDRATAAAADLAAAGFGTLDSNAVQLGKALQDPVKGLTALGRSGVTFTEEQKAAIKAMVESGDQAGAMAAVLEAVEGQVKGTAEATATESDKMAIAFGEVSESVGSALLPIIQELAPMLASMADFIAENTALIIPLGAAILGAAAALKIMAIAQTALNVAMSANVIGLIVIGIAALVAGIVLLWKNWDTVVAAFQKGWELIKNAAEAVIDWIKANWPLIVGIMLGPIATVVALIVTHWDQVKAGARAMAGALRGIWNSVVAFLSGIAGRIGSALQRVAAFFKKPADAARDMLERVKSFVGQIADFIGAQVGRISAAVSRIVDAIKRPINAVLGAINAISFTIPSITLPSVSIAGHKIGGQTLGGQTINFPDIPLLARGGVVSSPTLAVVGEGGGREIVAPEALLRQILAESTPEIHVYIGDQELRGMVRVEVASQNNRVAKTLIGSRALS